MILCRATLCLSHSVIKPTIRFQGNEWPSQFKGFSLRWRQQKATQMNLAACQALYQWLCFWGNMRGWTAVPSQRDSEWEGMELTQEPSCSAELWVFEWAMCCAEDSGGGCLRYLQTEAYCTSAKQGLTAFPYLSNSLPNHFSPFPTCYLLMSYKCLKRVKRKSLVCIAVAYGLLV